MVAFLILLGGPSRAPDTLARGSAWNDELRAPKRIIAHRIDQRAVKAEHSLDGWKSVQKLEFTPDSKEGKALAALFRNGRMATATVPDLGCTFVADFGLEFIGATGRRAAIFCFECGVAQGDSGIKGYDAPEVAAFAAMLFPGDAVFERVKEGGRAHPEATP